MSLESRITRPADNMADDAMAADAPAVDPSQMDGAGVDNSGNALAEVEFDVVVKPIDPNSPLYSVKSFEELGLFVTCPRLCFIC